MDCNFLLVVFSIIYFWFYFSVECWYIDICNLIPMSFYVLYNRVSFNMLHCIRIWWIVLFLITIIGNYWIFVFIFCISIFIPILKWMITLWAEVLRCFVIVLHMRSMDFPIIIDFSEYLFYYIVCFFMLMKMDSLVIRCLSILCYYVY